MSKVPFLQCNFSVCFLSKLSKLLIGSAIGKTSESLPQWSSVDNKKYFYIQVILGAVEAECRRLFAESDLDPAPVGASPHPSASALATTCAAPLAARTHLRDLRILNYLTME